MNMLRAVRFTKTDAAIEALIRATAKEERYEVCQTVASSLGAIGEKRAAKPLQKMIVTTVSVTGQPDIIVCKIEKGIAFLKLKTGKTIEVSLDRLREQDRTYLRSKR